MILTATIASHALTNGIFPVANAGSAGDVCVTSELKNNSKIVAKRGTCADTSVPGGSTPTSPAVPDGSTPTSTPTATPTSTPTSAPPVTPISYNNETIIGWASQNLSTISQDESDFGVQNGMLSTYVDFATDKEFPDDFAASAKFRGAALLIAWEPYNMYDPSLDQSEFRPASIATGSHDAYITDWLTKAQAKTADSSILVRFAPEMNDAVRPWSIGVNGGNTREDYINMWRHVYNIKKTVAPDVQMMWNPLVAGSDASGNPVSLTSVYPGSAYVDILALDGFNWADVQKPGTCNWQSYDDVFKAPVAEIKTLADGKPWGIAEVASVSRPDSFFQSGGACYADWGSWVYQWPESGEFYKTPEDWITQAGWMKTMMQQAHRDGALFVNMFNTNKETDWRLNSTDAGKAVLGGLTSSGSVTSGNTSSDLIKAALQ